MNLYIASIPVFEQMLGALSGVLAKGQAHAQAQDLDEASLLQARLAPDMFPLTRQVQIACDFAKGAAARLAGREPPAWADEEQSFAELQSRIARTLGYIGGVDAEEFLDAESREIVLRPGTQREQRFIGRDYLLHYALPHFFFHVTTAYDILRQQGVALGKSDYMGRS
ncbi:DUF1993 domain-containing protein [Pelomonas sp. CA6]|uniref:DUF1993 domain-containing protein n=1 Tax=Pelomonas sp. CA6 TaxID=2907999 RepID=UPI001F4AD441|nr:DUF1993 domain-containing protein [Pelomonas sp. CA6]MCH7342570.1 DUF1993 domain-containing protein [Pelomonas sp. CA6]